MPIGNIAKKRGKAKIKISAKREAVMQRLMDSYSEDFDVKMTVIQELIPLGLKAVADELQSEVKRLAGEKHSRIGNNARWGHQDGSVYLRDQKFPIKKPQSQPKFHSQGPTFFHSDYALPPPSFLRFLAL